MVNLIGGNVSEMCFIYHGRLYLLEILWLQNLLQFGQISLSYKCNDISSSSSKLPTPGIDTANLLLSPNNFYIIKQILLIWLNK